MKKSVRLSTKKFADIQYTLLISNYFVVFYIIAAALVTIPLKACGQSSQNYPTVRTTDQADDYHGFTVLDPFRWMEDLDSTELKTWMDAQDEWRASYLSDKELVKSLQDRIEATGSYQRRSIPVVKSGSTFYTDRAAGESFGSFIVQSGDDEPRELLDFEQKRSEGFSVSTSSISPDGAYITYNLAKGQSRWSTVSVMRVLDGVVLGEPLTGYYGGRSNIAWRQNGEGFYYTRYDEPANPQDPLGRPQVYYHVLGNSQREDQLVFEYPANPTLSFSLRTTHDGAFLVLNASESGGTFNGMYERLFYKDIRHPNSKIVELFEGNNALFAFEGNDGSLFRIRTTLDAPFMRVLELDIMNPQKWVELIPEAKESIQAVSEIGSRLVVQYVKDARILARVFDLEGAMQNEIDYLSPSMSGFADDRDQKTTYFAAPTLVDPGTIYSLNVNTGDIETYFTPKLNHVPESFERHQAFYKSKDGTRVPMFILHKKGLVRDSNNPVFLYGYGAWSWSAYPWQAHMIPWMEQGGIYVIANIRGGGEYGEAWHEAGIQQKKQNGIDDYIAAAEWLIENKYSSPNLMVANGGSASGILPGAAMIQRPDLFGASVINFPTLDQVRYDKFGSAKSWVSEFGDPNDPADFESLYAYSPYHNLEAGTCYPATWIQVGEKDETTTPMHGYKFAAALQSIQECENPVALKIAWGAGHSYGLTPEQSRQTRAEELAFLIKVLGINASNLSIK